MASGWIRHRASGRRRRTPRPEQRKVERPSYVQLMADVASMSVVAVGRNYGVSDKAVRKWIRWYEYQREMEEWRASEGRAGPDAGSDSRHQPAH